MFQSKLASLIKRVNPCIFKCEVLLVLLVSSTIKSGAISISSFTPTSGPVGITVSISGSGFNTTPVSNVVLFGATRAIVTSASATSLSVTVPNGANYMYITVTNLSNNLTAYSLKPFLVTTLCSSSSTFASATSVQTGSHNIEICDMDGDGKPDLVTPDYFNDFLVVTRNTSTSGNIAFAPKVTIPWAAGGQPNEVSIGDFDGDGKPDVALGGNGGGSFVSVYRNTSSPGTISFATRLDFAASSGQGNGNRIIDVDGDGKPDLLSVHWSGNCLWVLRNASTGAGNISFAAGVSFATTTQPHKMDVGDLDGDGKPDVVITAFTSNVMSVFKNTSSPGSISFAARQDFSPGTVPYYVHIGDLDGDGKADIAVVNRDVATMAVYRNISSPGTISLAARQDFATPAGTMTHYGVALGDLDGDGKPDVVAGNYTKNLTSVFRNTSMPGTISFASRVDLPTGISFDVGIDDFDGDGRPDIIATNSGSTASVLANVCSLIPLPIQLLSLSAELVQKKVVCNWSTASENNNAFFTVEKSMDGKIFSPIGKINGAGNSSVTLHYSFTDEYPFKEVNFYRLKQTDFNGLANYSNTIAVKGYSGAPAISIFPNPATDFLNCQTVLKSKTQMDIYITDLQGRILMEQKNQMSNGENSFHLNIHSLLGGVYFLKVQANEACFQTQFIKN